MSSLQVLGENLCQWPCPRCPPALQKECHTPQNTLEMFNFVEFEPSWVSFLIPGEETEGIAVGLLSMKEMSAFPVVFPES